MDKNSLYKWEHENRGLDHKCATCNHNLCSPRAKRSCFGLHEEVCIRYHKTLHIVGYSHKCDACHKSVELHDKRHREIGWLRNSLLQLSGKKAKGPLTAEELKRIHDALHPSLEFAVERAIARRDKTKLDTKSKKPTRKNCTSNKSSGSTPTPIPTTTTPTTTIEADPRITAMIHHLGICDNDISQNNKNKKNSPPY